MGIDACCDKCGRFLRDTSGAAHKCYPIWWVCCPDFGCDSWQFATKVYAASAEDAAERWAEETDREDYYICDGSPVSVEVVSNEDYVSLTSFEWEQGHAVIHKYKVSGEFTPTYTVREDTGE